MKGDGARAMRNENPDTDLIGGRYKKLRRLGGGSDGTVFLVLHLSTEKMRAAKCLPASEKGRRIHELDMMKKLRHSSLPEIIDVIKEGDQVWLIMEYVSGQALSNLAKEGFTAEQFFTVSLGLLEALSYLHTRRPPILHLDIKPTNILIREDGTPVLIDFGAAVFLSAALTDAGYSGTPGFAAPEQYGGNSVDVRTDLYGFGASMYYCLYGSAPSKTKQASGGRPGKAKIRNGQARQIGRILDRCLQEKKEQRFRDCETAYRAVRRLQRRHERKRQFYRAGGAVLLLFLSLLFLSALFCQENSVANEKRIREQYQQLLLQSEGMGFVQAYRCFERAASLLPEDGKWALALLERIGEDYRFTLEEEEVLKDLLYKAADSQGGTVLERLRDNPFYYGSFAYRLGIDYWYFYEEAGAKSAASFWFREAVLSQKEKGEKARAEWYLSAAIHADIASYYGELGKVQGRETEKILIYWDDLCRLWNMENLSQELPEVQRQIASELISYLTVWASKLQGKREYREVRRILSTLEEFLDCAESWEDGGDKEVTARQYQAAKAAVERVFADERGNIIDAEAEQTTE